jgi:hypothetical protein
MGNTRRWFVVASTAGLLAVEGCTGGSDGARGLTPAATTVHVDTTTPETSAVGTNPAPTATVETDPTVTEPAALGDTLAWGRCDDPKATDEDVRCATLTVPLDYDNPGGATVELALVKVPAAGTRRGAILFNPGGPGASVRSLNTAPASRPC